MLYAIYGLLILSIFLVVFAMYQIIFSTRLNIDKRLLDVTDKNIPYQPLGDGHLSFYEKYIKRHFINFTNNLAKLAPDKLSDNLENLILVAGSPQGLNLNGFIFIQFILVIILPSLTYFTMLALSKDINKLVILGVATFALALPYLIVRDLASKRKAKISKSLPEVLDLLYISVEAGLAFDMALKRTVEKMDGPLPFEFKLALDEISRGKVRSEALRGVVERTGVPELSTFITAVIQSEQLGSNIAKTLRVQSHALRQERRQKAEEAAMKIPIKMLFPLVFFMFPALFIIILGPALISILEMF